MAAWQNIESFFPTPSYSNDCPGPHSQWFPGLCPSPTSQSAAYYSLVCLFPSSDLKNPVPKSLRPTALQDLVDILGLCDQMLSSDSLCVDLIVWGETVRGCEMQGHLPPPISSTMPAASPLLPNQFNEAPWPGAFVKVSTDVHGVPTC